MKSERLHEVAMVATRFDQGPLLNQLRCPVFTLSLMLLVTVVAASSVSAQSLYTPSLYTPSARKVVPDEGVRFQPPAQVALVNATVVVSPDKRLENATLLVEDGIITAVGTEVDIPESADVIDCSGDFLYPAFIDAMVEFDAEDPATDGQHWNSHVMPHRRMGETIELEDGKLEALRQGGVAIALAAPAGGIFKGQSCVLSTGSTSLAESIIQDSGFQHIRLYPSRGGTRYPNSPMGAMALVRQTLSDAKWYQDATQAALTQAGLQPPEYSSALHALQDTVEGIQPVVIDGTNELYALRADRIAREFSLKLIVRGSGREYRRLDTIAEMGRILIVPVDFPDAPPLATEQEMEDATLQQLMHWKLAPSNAAKLEAAGVRFVLSSDGLDSPKDFIPNIRKAIEAGLDENAALSAVTNRPAELLGIEEEVGTLERGKLANLLRTDGPLFAAKTKLKETWVQGKQFEWVSDESLEVEGRWELALGDDTKLELEVSGTKKKPSVAIGPVGIFDSKDDPSDSSAKASENDAGNDPQGADAEESSKDEPKPTKLKKPAIGEYRVSGAFSTENLEGRPEGVALLSATKLSENDTLQLEGNLIWPDGTRTEFTAERRNSDGPQDSETHEADQDEEAESDETKSGEAEAGRNELTVNYPLGAYGRNEPPEQPEWLLFQGATIWTSSDQEILDSADLLIHDGVIEAVGQNLEAPEGAKVIDASGMHISPGIIDCHSHMATDGGVNESGQAITAEVRIGDFIDPNDINIYRQLAGGVTTSNILHGSANPIGGQNQVIKLRWGALDEELKMSEAPAGIKFALGENVKQSNRTNVDGTRYPQSRMGVEQIFRDRFEAAIAYRKKWQDWTRSPVGLPPRKDYELEAIAEIVEGTRWIHCHSYRQDEILTTLRVLEDYGITIGSLQHILEGYKVADAMAKHGATGSSFSDWWAYKFEVYDAIPYNGAIMHRAGVIVSFNSDDRELARHLNHEAAKAVKYGGVSDSEALKFVTLNPAKQLRIDRWVGSLEPGKHADFVVWNRSPLSTMSACMETWIDGRKYFDRKLDAQRQQSDESLRRQLIQEVVDSGAKSSPADDDDPSYWWARHDEFCHHGHDDHDEWHHESESHGHHSHEQTESLEVQQ